MLLADGELHSGEWLAAELRQTRAAVWKGVERLRASGIEVQALARRGYRLANPVELLDAGRILRRTGRVDRRPHLRSLELLFEVGFDQHPPAEQRAAAPGTADVCLLSCSTRAAGGGAGAGSRLSAAGIALSLGWTFSDGVRTLPALSLGVGVAVSRALARAGAAGITLKWPNDIWFRRPQARRRADRACAPRPAARRTW